MARARRIAVAGGGIAGLTAAIALGARGFHVTVFERSPTLYEVGAGLQLSPNATRILSRLAVLPQLLPAAVSPQCVELRRATSLRRVATVPLGDAAVKRWRSPYLTIHRADLQAGLLKAAASQPHIDIRLGATVLDAKPEERRVRLSIDRNGVTEDDRYDLLVAADGVWSVLRGLVREVQASPYSGYLAWRALLPATETGRWMPATDRVTTFLHPGFHLVAYPVRGGEALNLIAITKSPPSIQSWANAGDPSRLKAAMAGAAKDLISLVDAAPQWTTWPLHAVEPGGAWVDPRGIALIGDAAHAMPPFAAQGAAMAIEDAAVLAKVLDGPDFDVASSLRRYEVMRRERVSKVVKRGAFNRFAWHAGGPIAVARDAVLALRSEQSLAADMDWMYGWDPETAGH